MSAATAGADAGAPPAKGKKKLIIIVAAVLVLALGGVGALLALKKAPADEDEESPVAQAAAVKPHDAKNPPVFAPLEPFTVNLADREAERYAQVGITLELDDPHTADTLKAYLPAVRNNILLLLAAKTSTELLAADGKTQLAREVQHETARALGFVAAQEAEADDDEAASKKKKKKKKAEPALPITAVYFSTFIIQ